MNSRDPFEDRLAQTPFRDAPASLREQVLRAAVPGSAESTRSPLLQAWLWLLNSLWPHPIAWGTIGVAWIIVVGLNLAAFEETPKGSTRTSQTRVSPAWTAALRAQRALLQSLLQDPPVAPATEPAPGAQFRPDSYDSHSMLI